MQHTVCAFQSRRGKDLAYRNIDVCHTVFKLGLLFRVVKCAEHYLHIRAVAVHTLYFHVFRPVKGIDHGLLDFLI